MKENLHEQLGYSIMWCPTGPGLNLADWEDDGAGLAAYESVPGVNSPGSKPEPSKPEPGTIAWSLQCAPVHRHTLKAIHCTCQLVPGSACPFTFKSPKVQVAAAVNGLTIMQTEQAGGAL